MDESIDRTSSTTRTRARTMAFKIASGRQRRPRSSSLVHSIVAQGDPDGAPSDIHVNPRRGTRACCSRVERRALSPAADRPSAGMAVGCRVADSERIHGRPGHLPKKRLPQDGARFGLTVEGRRVDIRVATLPASSNGEGVVLRRSSTRARRSKGSSRWGHCSRTSWERFRGAPSKRTEREPCS